MSTIGTQVTITGLSKGAANALDRKAKRLGITVDEYLKELIAEDIKLDRVASTTTFAELALPFQKALEGLSDRDVDLLARPHKSQSNG